jgi:hypothetical protein
VFCSIFDQARERFPICTGDRHAQFHHADLILLSDPIPIRPIRGRIQLTFHLSPIIHFLCIRMLVQQLLEQKPLLLSKFSFDHIPESLYMRYCTL